MTTAHSTFSATSPAAMTASAIASKGLHRTAFATAAAFCLMCDAGAAQTMIGETQMAQTSPQATSPMPSSTAVMPSIIPSQAAGDTNVGNLIGAKVYNESNEQLGDVNYLLVNASGQITTAVIGVGGMLGVGEKNVAFPFSALVFATDAQGARIVKLPATADQLRVAAKFEWRETPMAITVEEKIKSGVDSMKATAKSLGDKASEAMKKN